MSTKQLEAQYRAFLLAKGDVNSLPTGSPLRNYIEYQQYKNPSDHELPSGSVPDKGGFTGRIVHPFSRDYTTGAQAVLINARLTGRANTFINGVLSPSLRSKLNYATATDAGIQLPTTKNVQAAKVIFKKTADTKSTRTSRITKRKYKAGKPDSYTVPFGRKNDATNYSDSVVEITTAKEVDGSGVKGDLWSLDFKQEVWNFNLLAVAEPEAPAP